MPGREDNVGSGGGVGMPKTALHQEPDDDR